MDLQKVDAFVMANNKFFHDYRIGAISELLLADLLRRRATLYRFFMCVDTLLQHRRIFVVFACVVLANWVWVLFHQL